MMATASTHGSVLVRGTQELLIRRYSTRKKAIRSRGFRVGGHLWAVSCVLGNNGHLASVSLELLHTGSDTDVVAKATLRIEHPGGGSRWRAEWRMDDAHVFPAWPSLSASARTWKLSLPGEYILGKERFVDDHGCFYVYCDVDVLLHEDSGRPAAEISVLPTPTISSDLGRLLLYHHHEEWWEEDPEETEFWRRRCMLPDVTFVVEHAEIHAHRLVLAMRSPVFAAEFRWHTTESTLHVHDMSASTFRSMLHFIYTDELSKPRNDDDDNVALTTSIGASRNATLDLLVAADRYDIGSLRLICENILAESLDVASVMQTLIVAHGRPSCQALEASCIQYMASDLDVYTAVKATEDYRELKESCCHFILDVTDKVAKINMTNTLGHDAPSSSNVRHPQHYSSEVLEGRHEFKIPHFMAVQMKHGVGKEISSDIFQVGGYDWKVKVYPSSSSEKDEGHVSVYAELLTDPGNAGVKAKVRFEIDDPSGWSSPSIKWLEKTFTARSDCGYAKFITTEYAESHNLADDGSLTVHCGVSVTNKVCTSTSAPTDGARDTMSSPSNIISHLEQLLVSEQGSDMRFLVEGKELKAHSLLIAARSPILYEAVTTANMDDNHIIMVNDVTAVVFKAMLHFIYTDELPPMEDLVHGVAEDEVTIAQDLLVAACSFGLDRMKAICENLLATFISKENASSTLELAGNLYCWGLKAYCVDFMTTSSRRSSSASRRTTPRASRAPASSASPGAAPSPTPDSSAGTANFTERLPCWASSAIPRASATSATPHGSYPPPPSARPLPTAAGHGRVLLHTDPYAGPVSLVVWDPVTDEQWALPHLPVTAPSQVSFNAVVLCAAAGCDHLDCHGGPFAVAYVGLRNQERSTIACLYSSEAGEWDKPAELEEATATSDKRPGVLVGNAAYFTCIHHGTRRIVEYDMSRSELSVIDLPPMHRCQPGTVLTVTEDGKLGFAGMHRLSLYLWSREAGPDGAVAWTQHRVIELETMLLYFSLGKVPVWHVPTLIGFAVGVGVVFVRTEAGRVFSVDLESGRYQKTSFPRFHGGDPDREPILIPYMSFYTPDRATRRSPSP